MEILKLNNNDLKNYKLYKKQGEEANIYVYDSNNILKIFKATDELSLLKKFYKMTALENEQLPENIVVPNSIVEIDDTFRGFKYPLVPSQNDLFSIVNYSNEQKINILKELSNVLKICHSKNIIFGDYHNENILIHNDKPYHIDVDSVQYKGYTDEVVCRLLHNLKISGVSKKSDIIAFHYYSFYLLTGIMLDDKNPNTWKNIINQTFLSENVKKIFMNMLDLPKGIYLGDYIDELKGEKPKEQLHITLIRKLFS